MITSYAGYADGSGTFKLSKEGLFFVLALLPLLPLLIFSLFYPPINTTFKNVIINVSKNRNRISSVLLITFINVKILLNIIKGVRLWELFP